jgi:hypothetical protein
MFKDLPLKECVFISLITNFVVALGIVAVHGLTPPVVPLFYGLPQGSAQLTPSYGLLLAPATGLVVTIVNLVIARLTNDVFFKKTLIISSLFITGLVTIAVIKIVFLVGFF